MKEGDSKYRIVEYIRSNGNTRFEVEYLVQGGWFSADHWVNIYHWRGFKKNSWDTKKKAEKALEEYKGEQLLTIKYYDV